MNPPEASEYQSCVVPISLWCTTTDAKQLFQPHAGQGTGLHRPGDQNRSTARRPPVGRCRRRSLWTAEPVSEQILRAGRHVCGAALSGAEPGRGPRPLLDRAEMAAHVIEHRGYLILRQFLDEPEQLLTLRGHEPSVRRPSQASVWLCAARSVSARAR
jgi:hypothetical protein